MVAAFSSFMIFFINRDFTLRIQAGYRQQLQNR